MFDFGLTGAQRQLRDGVRAFAEAEIKPITERCDRERCLVPEVATRFHETGYPQRFLGTSTLGANSRTAPRELVSRAAGRGQ
jgi:hypothetical protein